MKKNKEKKLTTSDKIDRIVTNRWLALPIFAVIMFVVYYVSVTTIGGIATDWANDGVFGDGWHLFGIGSSAAEEAADDYTAAVNAVNAYGIEFDTEDEAFDADATLAEMEALTSSNETMTVTVEDEETLAESDLTVYYDAIPDGLSDEEMEEVNAMSYKDAVAYFKENGFDEPDPADYGVWVLGIPALLESLFEKINCAEWLHGRGYGWYRSRCWCRTWFRSSDFNSVYFPCFP